MLLGRFQILLIIAPSGNTLPDAWKIVPMDALNLESVWFLHRNITFRGAKKENAVSFSGNFPFSNLWINPLCVSAGVGLIHVPSWGHFPISVWTHKCGPEKPLLPPLSTKLFSDFPVRSHRVKNSGMCFPTWNPSFKGHKKWCRLDPRTLKQIRGLCKSYLGREIKSLFNNLSFQRA